MSFSLTQIGTPNTKSPRTRKVDMLRFLLERNESSWLQ